MFVSPLIPFTFFFILLLGFTLGNTMKVYRGLVDLQKQVDQELANLNSAISQQQDQKQIEELREGYNELVFIWNNSISNFPEMILAKIFHFTEKPDA